MPRLAPAGRLAGRCAASSRGPCSASSTASEIRAEIERQLDRFEAGLQFPPDHIDGHQHVHVLPRMRAALLETRAAALSGTAAADPRSVRPLAAIAAAAPGGAQGLSVAALALGFADAARRRGLPINDSFAGFSDFDVSAPYADELQQRAAAAGPAAPRHVPSGPSRRRACRPRPGRRPAAHGVRRDHARSRPARSASGGLRAAPTGRRSRLAGAARLSAERDGNKSAPGAQHPVRHGLAFLVSGGTAFIVDALVLKLLTAVLGLHPIVARLAAISLAMVAGWLMHRTFTFAVTAPPSLPEFLRYAGVAWTAAAVNYGLFVLIVLAFRRSSRWWRWSSPRPWPWCSPTSACALPPSATAAAAAALAIESYRDIPTSFPGSRRWTRSRKPSRASGHRRT